MIRSPFLVLTVAMLLTAAPQVSNTVYGQARGDGGSLSRPPAANSAGGSYSGYGMGNYGYGQGNGAYGSGNYGNNQNYYGGYGQGYYGNGVGLNNGYGVNSNYYGFGNGRYGTYGTFQGSTFPDANYNQNYSGNNYSGYGYGNGNGIGYGNDGFENSNRAYYTPGSPYSRF